MPNVVRVSLNFMNMSGVRPAVEKFKHQYIDNQLVRDPLFISFILNLFLFACMYVFFVPHFGTNDDVEMLLGLSGVSIVAGPTSFMDITNLGIGFVLKGLYEINPYLPWYELYLVGILFLAHVIFLAVALRNKPSFMVCAVYFIYFSLLSYTSLLELTFTNAAMLLGFGGSALIAFDFSENSKKQFNGFRLTSGILLIVFGSMIRWESAVLSTMLILSSVLLKEWCDSKKVVVSVKSMRILLLIIVTLLLTLMVRQVNSKKLAEIEEGGVGNPLGLVAEFVDPNRLRFLDEKQREKIFESAGWTKNDYDMLKSWWWMDSEVYSSERLNKVLQEMKKIRNNNVIEFVRYRLRVVHQYFFNAKNFDNFFHSKGKYPTAVVGMLVFLTTLLFMNTRTSGYVFWTSILSTFVLAVIFVCFFKKGPPFRVYAGMITMASLLPLLHLNRENYISLSNFSVRRKIIGLILLIVVVGVSVVNARSWQWRSAEYIRKDKWLRQVVRDINPAENQLYVVWGAGFPFEWVLPFRDTNYLNNFKCFWLDGNQRYKSSMSILEGRGIKNIYKAIAEKENIFLIIRGDGPGNHLLMYKTFMMEHYHMSVEMRELYNNGVFNISGVLKN